MVLALIKAGANPKLSDAFGKNPADYSTLSKVIYGNYFFIKQDY